MSTPPQPDPGPLALIKTTLDNFNLAALIARLFKEYEGAPPPHATVKVWGDRASFEMGGNTSAFFTTPVLQMAILDCRRSLEFFGLTVVRATRQLRTIGTGKRPYPDDLGIEHFGPPRVSVGTFLEAVKTVGPVEPTLCQVYLCSNKHLAHFTTNTTEGATYNDVGVASLVLIQAYRVLLFEASGLGFPELQPKLVEIRDGTQPKPHDKP